MTYTENYALNQWAKTDRLMMSDFNADNTKLDAALKSHADALAAETAARAAAVAACGNCRIVTGTYTGNGTSGSENKNTITFGGDPLIVFVGGDTYFYVLAPSARTKATKMGHSSTHNIALTWGTNSVSWYDESGDASFQCNADGATYYYIALLASN